MALVEGGVPAQPQVEYAVDTKPSTTRGQLDGESVMMTSRRDPLGPVLGRLGGYAWDRAWNSVAGGIFRPR